ncbi:MAG: hypothetical protein KDC67_03110 [Ignavibacteriae bacterium]|nr:hypothetical protein [Ignavibacteriota bacterium]
MTTQQMPLIEPITNDFIVYDLHEMKSGESRTVEFETELYTLDAQVTFTIDSVLEEGGCEEEMLRTITGVKVNIEIEKVWSKDGESRIYLSEKDNKNLLKELYNNLENEINEYIR